MLQMFFFMLDKTFCSTCSLQSIQVFCCRRHCFKARFFFSFSFFLTLYDFRDMIIKLSIVDKFIASCEFLCTIFVLYRSKTVMYIISS